MARRGSVRDRRASASDVGLDCASQTRIVRTIRRGPLSPSDPAREKTTPTADAHAGRRSGPYRNALLWGVIAAINLAFALGAYKAYRYVVVRRQLRAIEAGMALNREAWAASFQERGTAPPPGPRDGYWGADIGKEIPHPRLGWTPPTVSIPGRLELGPNGMQHVAAAASPHRTLLVLGASVAFGAYASTIERTYFHRLSVLAAEEGLPLEVWVISAGGWKSIQEVDALELLGLARRPDVVLFLNGLNDLTVGSNARTLFGQKTRTLDGSPWHLLYHEHDYADRTAAYLANMRRARELVRARGIPVVFALQPSLVEKHPLSDLERRVLELSLQFHASAAALEDSYQAMRVGLADLADRPGEAFVDCSRIFDGETSTTFADLWHFSDPGHEILARRLVQGLAPVLRAAQVEAAARGR
jgi:lysophospholipase L1-like esterase